MTQTNLDQYALNNGFGKTTAKMTEQEKVMLQYQYVTSALSNATGDFVKTQDSWANQTRILSLRFEQLKASLGKGFIALFTPILRGFNSLLAGLQKVADGFANFVQMLTGADISSSMGSISADIAGIGDDAGGAADNIGDIGSAAKKTAKDIERSLAGFDQISKLTEPTDDSSASGSGTDSTSGIGSVDLVPDVSGSTANVSSAISDMADKVKKALEPLKAISFDNLVSSLDNLKRAVQPLTDKLFAGLEWAYYNIFVPLAKWTIEDLLPEFLDVLAGCLDVLNSALDALKPLWMWAWDNFLEPVASWTGGVIVDVLKGLASALEGISDWIKDNQGPFDAIVVTIGAFAAAWKAVDLAEFLMNAGGVVGIINKLKKAIEACTVAKLKDKIETIQLCAMYAKDFVKSVGQTIAKLSSSAVAWVSNTAVKVADTTATVAHTAATWLATAATTAFGVAMTVLTSPITLVIAALVALGVGIYELVKHWDVVKEAAGICWDWIVGKWNSAGEWFAGVWENIRSAFSSFDNWLQNIFNIDFSDSFGFIGDIMNAYLQNVSNIFGDVKQIFGGLIDFIAGVFSGDWSRAWNGIVDAFGGIFSLIADIAKGPINMVIGLINGMLDGLESGINWIVRKINGLSFDVPDWVPVIGGDHFGFDLPEVGFGSIPYLAEGGYVKPNTPQLAMIGDNKHQGEVVAPEDKLLEMAQKAADMASSAELLAEAISILKQILRILETLDLDIQLDGKSLKKYVVDKINEHTKATGKCEIIT
jgi:phage-related protein